MLATKQITYSFWQKQQGLFAMVLRVSHCFSIAQETAADVLTAVVLLLLSQIVSNARSSAAVATHYQCQNAAGQKQVALSLGSKLGA